MYTYIQCVAILNLEVYHVGTQSLTVALLYTTFVSNHEPSPLTRYHLGGGLQYRAAHYYS